MYHPDSFKTWPTFSVLTSTSHMLKLEQYTEDQRGPCTKMTHKFVKCSIFIVKPINFFKALKKWPLWHSSYHLPSANCLSQYRQIDKSSRKWGLHSLQPEWDCELGTHCSQMIFLKYESDHEDLLYNTIQWFPIALQIKLHPCCVATGKLLNLSLAQFPLL